MKTFRTLAFIAAFFAIACPAAAQWQTPDHSVPIGNGAGVTGFNSAGPCAAGIPLVGNGSTTDPSCQQIVAAGIANNAVTTPAINNAAVTYAKIQNEGAATVHCNPTGSPATMSECTLGSQLSFVGSVITSAYNPALFQGYINGLTLSTAGGSNTFGVAAGVAMDRNNGGFILLNSNYTKTTAAWLVGTGLGALDTGAIATNTWYTVFGIERPDTGVVDICITLTTNSACATGGANPIPAAYTLQRRIGWLRTDGTGGGPLWLGFTMINDKVLWNAVSLDISAATGTAARQTITLLVPTGTVVTALFRVTAGSNGAVLGALQFPALTENDVVVTSANADFQATNGQMSGNLERTTNTAAQIGERSNIAGNVTNINLNTYGWIGR